MVPSSTEGAHKLVTEEDAQTNQQRTMLWFYLYYLNFYDKIYILHPVQMEIDVSERSSDV